MTERQILTLPEVIARPIPAPPSEAEARRLLADLGQQERAELLAALAAEREDLFKRAARHFEIESEGAGDDDA